MFRTGKNYYPQVFSEEYKYVIKEEKIPKYIIDDMEIPCDSNEENYNEKTRLEKIKMKKNSDYEENSDKEILKKKIRLEKSVMKKTQTKKIFMKINKYIYK